MQTVHPLQFVAFFAEVEQCFCNQRNHLLDLHAGEAELSRKFLDYFVPVDGYKARYEIGLHTLVNRQKNLVWKLSLYFGEETILTLVTFSTKDPDNEDTEDLFEATYSSFDELHKERCEFCGIIEDSIRNYFSRR